VTLSRPTICDMLIADVGESIWQPSNFSDKRGVSASHLRWKKNPTIVQ
jgi:hypothetical protein